MAGWIWLRVSHKVAVEVSARNTVIQSLMRQEDPLPKILTRLLARVVSSLSCWLPHRAAHTGQPACSRADDDDAKERPHCPLSSSLHSPSLGPYSVHWNQGTKFSHHFRENDYKISEDHWGPSWRASYHTLWIVNWLQIAASKCSDKCVPCCESGYRLFINLSLLVWQTG